MPWGRATTTIPAKRYNKGEFNFCIHLEILYLTTSTVPSSSFSKSCQNNKKHEQKSNIFQYSSFQFNLSKITNPQNILRDERFYNSYF